MKATITRWPAIVLVAALTSGAIGPAVQRAAAGPLAQVSPGDDRRLTVSDAPIPIEFPRDDGPHAAPIEWWYYTGHLTTDADDRYGFQLVVFKGERGGLIAYAAHFAVTDNVRGVFRYEEQLVPGAGVSTPVPGGGFDLRVGDWRMSGAGGEDRLVAGMPGYAISLKLTSAKPPVLHGGDGYIPYGTDQATYYYSRTRLDVSGSLAVDGEPRTVGGTAWMDHQWGAFTTYEDGGWDWYALQLDDGWDLMLYRIVALDGTPEIAHGSLVAPDGAVTDLDGDDFVVMPLESWHSAATGATYPSGWEVALSGADLVVTVTPTLVDQEIDATASTGQIYWEGEVAVVGTRAGRPVGGWGYVELTGYADRSSLASTAEAGRGVAQNRMTSS